MTDDTNHRTHVETPSDALQRAIRDVAGHARDWGEDLAEAAMRVVEARKAGSERDAIEALRARVDECAFAFLDAREAALHLRATRSDGLGGA